MVRIKRAMSVHQDNDFIHATTVHVASSPLSGCIKLLDQVPVVVDFKLTTPRRAR